MKRALVLAVVCGMVAQGAFAGGFAFFGAYWDAKDYTDATDNALYGGGLKARYDINPNLALEGRGSVLFDEVKDGAFKSTFMVIPAEFNVILSLLPAETLNPYIGGGAGYYMFTLKEKGPGYSESLDVDDEFGLFGVGGVEVALGEGARLFVEAKYTAVEIKEIEDSPASLKLDGFGATAGLMLVW